MASAVSFFLSHIPCVNNKAIERRKEKMNEDLRKFAEKYNWKLEVWHGEYKGVLCGVQEMNPGEPPLPLYRFPGGVSLE